MPEWGTAAEHEEHSALWREIELQRRMIGDLIPQREQLERRIDDLFAFEREYRARQIAFHEDCLRKLRGESDAR